MKVLRCQNLRRGSHRICHDWRRENHKPCPRIFSLDRSCASFRRRMQQVRESDRSRIPCREFCVFAGRCCPNLRGPSREEILRVLRRVRTSPFRPWSRGNPCLTLRNRSSFFIPLRKCKRSPWNEKSDDKPEVDNNVSDTVVEESLSRITY